MRLAQRRIPLAFAPAAEGQPAASKAQSWMVAEHMAGHRKLGSAAGCAIGHHETNKTARAHSRRAGRDAALPAAHHAAASQELHTALVRGDPNVQRVIKGAARQTLKSDFSSTPTSGTNASSHG